MQTWTIYCHTHTETGLRYVGQTTLTWQRRWTQHLCDARKLQTPFARALIAFGPSAFSHELLETCSSREEANAAEARWIAHFDTRNPMKGLNVARGGWYRPSISESIRQVWERPGHRERVSAANIEASTPELRAKRSISAKAQMSVPGATDRLVASNRASWGPERAAKLSEARAAFVASGRRPREGQTHCKRGHEFTPENTIVNRAASRKGRGASRICRECKRAEERTAKRKRVRVMMPEQRAKKTELQRLRRARAGA